MARASGEPDSVLSVKLWGVMEPNGYPGLGRKILTPRICEGVASGETGRESGQALTPLLPDYLHHPLPVPVGTRVLGGEWVQAAVMPLLWEGKEPPMGL